MSSAGAVQTVATDGSGVWLAGSVNGGVWRSTDVSTAARPAWKNVFDGQPVSCYSISAVAMDTAGLAFAGCGGSTSSEMGNSVVLVNTGPWAGVAMSEDAGETWAMTSFPSGYYVSQVVIVNASTVLVAARGAYYNESDGGVWIGSRTTSPPSPWFWLRTLQAPVFSLATGPTPGQFMAAVVKDAQHAVYASVDSGASWRDFSAGVAWKAGSLPFYSALAVRSTPPTAYLVGLCVAADNPDDTSTRLFSVDLSQPLGTKKWVPLPTQHSLDDDGMPKDRAALLPDPSSAGTLFVAGNGGDVVYRVDVASGTWTSMLGNDTADGSAPHVDCRHLAWDAARKALILTSDGGMFMRSSPNTAGAGRWTSLNGDIKEMEFLSVAYDAENMRWIAGAQDNDVQVSKQGVAHATGVVLGDGTVVAADNTLSPPRLFGARQFLGVGPADAARGPGEGGGDDDDGDLGAGLMFVQGEDVQVGIDLGDLGFGAPTCLPFFVSPFTLSRSTPQTVVFWANCECVIGDVLWDCSVAHVLCCCSPSSFCQRVRLCRWVSAARVLASRHPCRRHPPVPTVQTRV